MRFAEIRRWFLVGMGGGIAGATLAQHGPPQLFILAAACVTLPLMLDYWPYA